MDRRQFFKLSGLGIGAVALGSTFVDAVADPKILTIEFNRDIYLPTEVHWTPINEILHPNGEVILQTTGDVWFLTQEQMKGRDYDFTMEEVKRLKLKDIVAFVPKEALNG